MSSDTSEELVLLRAQRDELLEALSCAEITMCGIAVPHSGERDLLRSGLDIVRGALTKVDGILRCKASCPRDSGS